ncbi:MAG: glycosyltransferase [Nitrospiraceae bacterium]|nr:MAG: glycosyltransferase [Nitrospiraceae bacterium]
MIKKVSIKGEGYFNVNACTGCSLTDFHPFPKLALLKELLLMHQEKYPAYDDSFDWRLFFARRYLIDGSRVLNIGAESRSLAAAFKKENIDLIQINTMDPDTMESFSDGEFDAVFVWDILSFIKHIKHFFRQVRRVLKKEGYISIRDRDSMSSLNINRENDNFASGLPSFINRKFLLRVYKDVFHEVPHCFTQDVYSDSTIVALGKSSHERVRDYSMQVLVMVHHFLFSKLEDATGPRGRVLNTIEMLDRYGVKADVSLSLKPRAKGYDIVHIFHNAWETQDGLSQMVSAKADNVKVIISTIYMDPSETNFVINTIKDIFKIPGRDERHAVLSVLAHGGLRAGNLKQEMRFYAKWNIEEDQKALLEMSDRIICFSHTEMRQISLNLDRTPPFSIVYNSANDEMFGIKGPEEFVAKYGIRDFVVAAGHVEWRKNQLMLLYALREYPDIPVIIVGASSDDEYAELCRLWSHKNTIFISQLKHRHLASAFSAARVHAQPSWIEGISLSSIEAAMCGCTPVVADRAGEIEYYSHLGYYANPGSIDSIKRAVLTAFHNHTPEVRSRTSAYIKDRYTFKNAVEMTIDAYNSTIGRTVKK